MRQSSSLPTVIFYPPVLKSYIHHSRSFLETEIAILSYPCTNADAELRYRHPLEEQIQQALLENVLSKQVLGAVSSLLPTQMSSPFMK